MYPLPTDFPAEALGYFMGMLRGTFPDTKTACHAAWEVAGYGIAYIPSANLSLSMDTGGWSREQWATAIEAHLQPPVGLTALPLDWGKLGKLALEILLQILATKGA